jgi:hypothetical protein
MAFYCLDPNKPPTACNILGQFNNLHLFKIMISCVITKLLTEFSESKISEFRSTQHCAQRKLFLALRSPFTRTMLQILQLYKCTFIAVSCLMNLRVRNTTTGKYAGGNTIGYVRLNK